MKSCGTIRAENAAADRKAKRIRNLATAQLGQPGDVLVNVSLTRAEYAAVLELEATGLFGIGLQGVIEGLLQDRIRECVLEGWVSAPVGNGTLRRPGR